MTPIDYLVRDLDGDYAQLQRLDDPSAPLKPVARALLPEPLSEGDRLRYEMLEYTKL
ncbi:MAG TPA: chorismate--pyruvate lyase [Candidatus Avoscillospira stercorigallinarum]|uniref:Chorismate--pyruvate lyase n=1 Tax=Candidatus Avoscillospira stercorigallinarum TaxID=2840708 RepID=A0A9D0Z645_9FIRM|nr:chorismate--pyruvate lyase [Candidatus Avoscillospira stercorigallinarum]